MKKVIKIKANELKKLLGLDVTSDNIEQEYDLKLTKKEVNVLNDLLSNFEGDDDGEQKLLDCLVDKLNKITKKEDNENK